MKLAKSQSYSDHAATIGSHADHWLIPSERTGLLNTEIVHEIINVAAQAARGLVQHIFELHKKPCRDGGDCIDIIVQSLTFKAQAFTLCKSSKRPLDLCTSTCSGYWCNALHVILLHA